MPSWWGRSSSKDVKKKTSKDNIIETFHRFIIPNDQKGQRSRGSKKHSNDAISEKGSRSIAESRSMSPSAQVSRCQSFADRPQSQPLPLPGSSSFITRTTSEISTSKPILEKRGKQQLLLPLPTPNRTPRRLDIADTDGDLAAGSISSNCSNDSDDAADSQLPSPVGNDLENDNKGVTNSQSRDHSFVKRKNLKDLKRPVNLFSGKQAQSSAKQNVLSSDQCNFHIPQHGAFASAPDSSMSSPSRSPRVVFPELIPTSAFWAAKPHQDVAFLSSGQCSSPGSGHTSGHNSMGGEMLGQLWQHSRGSPECSPIPSPRITSSGPSSRIHSGTVSPLHPRAGGTTPESPTSRNEEPRKQSHRLPLPPINISNVSSPFSPNSSAANASPSIPRSPGRADTPTSPGSRWKKGKLIGHGTFGHVYVGFNSESGEMCAMKEVTLFMDDAKSKESAKQLGQEILLLSRLRHPNIVQYYGSEMIDDKLYIYLEYVSGGSIHKLLQEYGQFGEPAIRSYTQQILSGLAFLHAKNTVHRDIKGANILVDPNGRVKLADFGMAKHITGQSCPLSFKGSPYWMAPEVIKNSNGCNLAVDIWSLGCTVFEMSTSKPPWSQYEGIAAMFKIGNSKELPAIPDHLSDDGKDFILQCLQRDPSKRPTAAELLQHPFVKNAALVEKPMLCFEREEQTMGALNGLNSKGIGHTRNLSSLDMEGLTINQISGGISSGLIRYISCPVSPIGSPLLNSRSTHHINGRMSPSPISSPRTTSGTSTPLTCGNCGISGRMSPSPISSPRTASGASTPLTCANGAIPFNQPKRALYLHEGLTSSSKSTVSFYPNGTIHNEPKLDLFLGMQQPLHNQFERMASDATMMGPQFGKLGHVSPWEPMLADRLSHQTKRDQMKLKPSLDLNSGSLNLRRRNGI